MKLIWKYWLLVLGTFLWLELLVAPVQARFTAVVNPANATTVDSYDYDPFSETIRAKETSTSTSRTSVINPFRYSCEYNDVERVQIYCGYRYYSPSLRRWPNRDPLGERGGLNLYSYVSNNPINSIDPLGLRDGEVTRVDIGIRGPGPKPDYRQDPRPKTIPGTQIPLGAGPLDTATAIDEFLRNRPIPVTKYKPGKNSGDYNHCMFGCLLGMANPMYAAVSGFSELTGFEMGDLWSDYVGSFWGLWDNLYDHAGVCEARCKDYVSCK